MEVGESIEAPFKLFKALFSSYLYVCSPEQSTRVCLMIVHVFHVTNGPHCHFVLIPRSLEYPILTIDPFVQQATRPDLDVSQPLCPFCPSFSCSLQVFVLLAEDRHLIFEEHGVQAKLRVDQRHVAKPVGKGVDTLLPLVEVLRVGPGDTLRTLGGRTRHSSFIVLYRPDS